MNTLIRSAEFIAWLDGLRDLKGKARILSRLDLALSRPFRRLQIRRRRRERDACRRGAWLPNLLLSS
jgi:hypothetical protein